MTEKERRSGRAVKRLDGEVVVSISLVLAANLRIHISLGDDVVSSWSE